MAPGAQQPQGETLAPPLSTRSTAWRNQAFRVLRIVVTVEAFAILLQAVTAGQLLSGNSAMRAVHGAGAGLVLLLALAQLVAAVLIWRPGRGSARLLGPSVGIVVAVLVQAVAGAAHVRELHVPLGVLMFGGSLALMRQLWSSTRTVA